MMAYQPTRGILDGSKCWVTLSSTAPFTVNACSLCSPEDNCPQSFVISPEMGAKVCLRIGHAPDLMDGFRGSIEQVLRTLNLGSTTTLTVAEGDRSPIKVCIPLCSYHTGVCLAGITTTMRIIMYNEMCCFHMSRV